MSLQDTQRNTQGLGIGKLCQVLENGLGLMGGLSKESALEDTIWARCRNLETKLSSWRQEHGLRITRIIK